MILKSTFTYEEGLFSSNNKWLNNLWGNFVIIHKTPVVDNRMIAWLNLLQ